MGANAQLRYENRKFGGQRKAETPLQIAEMMRDRNPDLPKQMKRWIRHRFVLAFVPGQVFLSTNMFGMPNVWHATCARWSASNSFGQLCLTVLSPRRRGRLQETEEVKGEKAIQKAGEGCAG